MGSRCSATGSTSPGGDSTAQCERTVRRLLIHPRASCSITSKDVPRSRRNSWTALTPSGLFRQERWRGGSIFRGFVTWRRCEGVLVLLLLKLLGATATCARRWWNASPSVRLLPSTSGRKG